MHPDFDVVVVGGGVIGLAVAYMVAVTKPDHSILILERAATFGSETSSRNSEVIHAGIYYPEGSLKARLCASGKALLYDFCAKHDVPVKRCGKLIVATDESELSKIMAIQASAARCGVDDLRLIDRVEANRLEPDIACIAALVSPSTGIIDSHAYMQTLLGIAEANGATLVCNTEVTAILRRPEGWAVEIAGTDSPVVTTRAIVNAAGLGASALARKIEAFPMSYISPLWLAKGSYFSYDRPTRFRHLVYPVPQPGGLGVHLTLDMSGRARFGPDVEWVEELNYSVDPGLHGPFVEAIARYWPTIDPAALRPGYAGIRPKLSPPGSDAADFVISGPQAHGVDGIVNLFGIESPGITASLAIAKRVVNEIGHTG